ncbi:hypothetical protein JCM18916_2777 [Cutibacterium acnes JCM 18916]|nr:hypothetical protein JCM18916_2777 [Cutibacterium acnes JCM 18916]
MHRLPVGHNFQLDADALANALAACRRQGEHPAVLTCETFGIQPSSKLIEVLKQARRDGVPVIVDRTHSFLAPSRTPADIEVVSTRKLLPLTEVAWVQADEDLSELVGTRDNKDVFLTSARRRFFLKDRASTPSKRLKTWLTTAGFQFLLTMTPELNLKGLTLLSSLAGWTRPALPS